MSLLGHIFPCSEFDVYYFVLLMYVCHMAPGHPPLLYLFPVGRDWDPFLQHEVGAYSHTAASALVWIPGHGDRHIAKDWILYILFLLLL